MEHNIIQFIPILISTVPSLKVDSNVGFFFFFFVWGVGGEEFDQFGDFSLILPTWWNRSLVLL